MRVRACGGLDMYKKELLKKICDISCSSNELDEFVSQINKNEYDSDNPFEKYYDVDRLIVAIDKYNSKEIDAKFLAHWMNAYNWIVMGGFKRMEDTAEMSLKKLLIWTISDWIDSLSFFDGSDFYNLEEYKTIYRTLDSILQDAAKCKAVSARQDADGEEMVVLVYEDNKKYFIKLYVFDYDNIGLSKVDLAELNRIAGDLTARGYRELLYCDWE